MLSSTVLLAANSLIAKYEGEAEEYVTTKLWDARQSGNNSEIAKWQQLIEALKEVRRIGKETSSQQ